MESRDERSTEINNSTVGRLDVDEFVQQLRLGRLKQRGALPDDMPDAALDPDKRL